MGYNESDNDTLWNDLKIQSFRVTLKEEQDDLFLPS